MKLLEYVDKQFDENLRLAREQLLQDIDEGTHTEGEFSDLEAWNIATEWTLEEITMLVNSRLEHRWAGQQEAINKEHYE